MVMARNPILEGAEMSGAPSAVSVLCEYPAQKTHREKVSRR